jgi:hypothetical protein
MISRKKAIERAKKAQLTRKKNNPHPCLCEICQTARIKSGYVGARTACAYIDDKKIRAKIEKMIEQCYGGWVKRTMEERL